MSTRTEIITSMVGWWRLHEHAAAHCLFPVYQSTYRPRHSTETAVVDVLDKIFRAVDSDKVCALVLLDLSAAFDTVDHSILLTVLKHRFGVHEGVLDWFRSYLTGRTQCVSASTGRSEPTQLTCEVPQGSSIDFLYATIPSQTTRSCWKLFSWQM